MQFWGVLGRFGPKTSVACPQNREMHFPKIRIPDFGTTHSPIPFCGMPPKQGNALSENKNPRFWDYNQPDSVLWHVPKTGKCTFRKHECPISGLQLARFRFVACPQNREMHFPKIRIPKKGAIIICQTVGNI